MRAVIPRRTALPVDRGVLIVAHATHKQKALFFFLVQARPLRGVGGQICMGVALPAWSDRKVVGTSLPSYLT